MKRYADLTSSQQVVSVHFSPLNSSLGKITFGGWCAPCALGRKGRTHRKREGDWATPVGEYGLVGVYYRPDRGGRPHTALPVRALKPTDGWCDDPSHRLYNRPVDLPFAASHENLWCDDRLYDVIVVLDFNLSPAIKGRGSAIFLHVAREGFSPTAGCVAIAPAAMRCLLAWLKPGARLRVHG